MSFYLGLDSSTQSLTAFVIDTDLGEVVVDESVQFEQDLPHYESPNGVLPNSDPLVKHSDPLMWVEALDMVLSRVKGGGFDLGAVAGISGSGQQHGSVYLNSGFPELSGWDPASDLAPQVKPLLSRASAPIWMDSSTGAQCAAITEAVGTEVDVVHITGSRAIERFTGPQIRKFAETEPERWQETARVHLVSSFMAAVMCGRDTAIDHGDGAGMNLLNITSGDWSQDMMDATADGLAEKLPQVLASGTRAGEIDRYFVERYGFKAGTPVTVWSGDNPNSLVGMGSSTPGTAVVSLGTSDTFFAAMSRPVTDPEGFGHVFGNPAGGFMSLICFKNGSLVREHVRDRFAMTWQDFEDAITDRTVAGNDGNLMLPYLESEITPLLLAAEIRLYGTPEFCEWKVPDAAVRAVVEAQAVSMRIHSEWILDRPSEIRVTGGGSRNKGILQIFADVFGARIECLTVSNSAALGAALRAAHACEGMPWQQLFDAFAATDAGAGVDPNPAAAEVYQSVAKHFERRLREART